MLLLKSIKQPPQQKITAQRGATRYSAQSQSTAKIKRQFMPFLACGIFAVLLFSLVFALTIEQKKVKPIDTTNPPTSSHPITQFETLTLTPAEQLPLDLLAPPAPELEPEPEPEPIWIEQTVRPGDNLSLIFFRAGFNNRDVYEVTKADGGRALRKIHPGETIAFLIESNRTLKAVNHVESQLKSTLFERTEKGFSAKTTVRELDIFDRSTTMRITSSLFLAGKKAGLSNRVIMDLARIFGGVIDFALDPRVGDTIELVFEEQWLDGKKIADGEIIAAAFTNKGETFEAYRYTDIQGNTSYYNEQGVSMHKAFLLAPLDFTRVSSNFNPNRFHPIYKVRRPHRGTDYAAPSGTPVYAAGDGRVSKSNYNKANGNYVFIQHGESYKTKYLHLTKRKVRVGERVKQGQLIGTVGSTGSASGPHLHYEFLINDVHHNPRTVHKLLPKAKSLPKTELARFTHQIKRPLQQLAALRKTSTLALSQATTETHIR